LADTGVHPRIEFNRASEPTIVRVRMRRIKPLRSTKSQEPRLLLIAQLNIFEFLVTSARKGPATAEVVSS
jgi:hypothetical protein